MSELSPYAVAQQTWHDAAGQVGSYVVQALQEALMRNRSVDEESIKAQPLTMTEARVLWTALHNAYAPTPYYSDWQSAMKKLLIIGGGYACRDCAEQGRTPSRLGGFLCERHKADEVARYSDPGR